MTPTQPAEGLPDPAISWPTGAWLRNGSRVQPGDYYTADQMRAYAREAIAAVARERDELREALSGLLNVGDSYTGDPDDDAAKWVAATDRARAALGGDGE